MTLFERMDALVPGDSSDCTYSALLNRRSMNVIRNEIYLEMQILPPRAVTEEMT